MNRNEPAPDRQPPHNLEAEADVIGACLLDNAQLAHCLGRLRPADFFRDAHEVVWEAAARLHEAGTAVDATTLYNELDRSGRLDRAGGLEYVAALAARVPHAANARYHAEIVREKSDLRRVAAGAEDLIRQVYQGNATAQALTERWQQAAAALADRNVPDAVTPLRAALARSRERLDRRQHGGPAGLTSGWPDLDVMGDGFHADQLVIVAGRPSMGKTALALNLARRFAVRLGVPSLFFSLEMNQLDLTDRLVCIESGVFNHKLKDPGEMDDRDLDRVMRAYGALDAAPLYLDDNPNRSAFQIGVLARQYARSHGVRAVFVDYMQLVDAEAPRDGRQEQIAKISRSLKKLSRELQVPVFALSQLNRAVENREDRRPRLADLRESGAIEQDADVVILVHRPHFYDPNEPAGLAELIVAKNRNGATGTVRLEWCGPTNRFTDGVVPDAAPAAAGAF